jgi:hypothetical protein
MSPSRSPSRAIYLASGSITAGFRLSIQAEGEGRRQAVAAGRDVSQQLEGAHAGLIERPGTAVPADGEAPTGAAHTGLDT